MSLQPDAGAGAAEPPGVPGAEGDERAFDTFAPRLHRRGIPIVLFSDDACQQFVWHDGGIENGQVRCPSGPADVWSRDAVVMSPAYLGFAIEPSEPRYLGYKGIGIVFARPRRGQFMQPSIDTILVCRGLAALLAETGLNFKRAVDIGTGSGFLGKFAAAYAPGEGELRMTLVDIDPAAADFCESPGFGARSAGAGGRAISWDLRTGDGARCLEEEDPGFDLIVSNPPYIPTKEEASEDSVSQLRAASFWEGCGLLARMLELMLEGRYLPNAHLVIGITSLTLKSARVRALLAQMPSKGIRVRKLVEREVAWKAWYAGRGGGPSYLLASAEEVNTQAQVGECSFYVGCTPPRESRVGGARNDLLGYHWHVAYVLDIAYREDEGL